MCRKDIIATFRIPFDGKDVNGYEYDKSQIGEAIEKFKSSDKQLPLAVNVADHRYELGQVTNIMAVDDMLIVDCTINIGGTIEMVKKDNNCIYDIDIKAICLVACMEIVFPCLNY